VQPQKKQLVHEKEMQQLKLQQEKDLPQDENVVVEQQNVDQHEEKLQQKDDHPQKEDDDDNLVFTFFYLNYKILILPRNFRT